jgi:ribosomal protein L11 methyltransferase
MAFGTGHHDTTRLALMALARHLSHGERVLDVGTRSGILAIAAEKLGGKALGVDVDPSVLPQAEANARRNGVYPRFLLGSLEAALPLAPFGLVVANLFAELPRRARPPLPGGPRPRGAAPPHGHPHGEGPPWCGRLWRTSPPWRRRPRGSGSS